MSRRKMRTQSEWKVAISGLASERPPTSCSTRSPISEAALLVKVTARMESGMHALLLDQPGDAAGDDAGFAGTGAGKDQHRALGGFDGLALLRIELIKKRQMQDSSRRYSLQSYENTEYLNVASRVSVPLW